MKTLWIWKVFSHKSQKRTLNIFYADFDCQAVWSNPGFPSFDEKVTKNKKLIWITFLRRKHSSRKESSYKVVFFRTFSKVTIMLYGDTSDELKVNMENQTKTLWLIYKWCSSFEGGQFFSVNCKVVMRIETMDYHDSLRFFEKQRMIMIVKGLTRFWEQKHFFRNFFTG